MTPNEYLNAVLKDQNVADDSKEMKELQQYRKEVEDLLMSKFSESSPTIRYGGSKAKGTLIKESYDLDIVCYFPRKDDDAGETLKDIYDNVKLAFQNKNYNVVPKGSAIRIKNPDGVDFHIDVVPGRFVDEKKEDAFLYRATGEKSRLKTNLQKHIDHVKNSEVRDAIKLAKLWKTINAVEIKTFVLELLVIEILKKSKKEDLYKQFGQVLINFRDDLEKISIEDPANPDGNDLSELMGNQYKQQLSMVARSTIAGIEASGWESVFGKIQLNNNENIVAGLRNVASTSTEQHKPWSLTK